MESKWSAFATLILLVATTPQGLASRSLRHGSDNQTKANAMGIEAWCQFCEATAELLSTQLFIASASSITAGEAMILLCGSSEGARKTLCEKLFSGTGETVGSLLTASGEFVLPSCSYLPFCPETNKAEHHITGDLFDYLCTQCKSIASILFGKEGNVFTFSEPESKIHSFCEAMSVIHSPDRCVKDLSTNFKQAQEQGNLIASPATVCEAYGVCIPMLNTVQ